MRCPRCGHQAEGMARACPACGYILPFSLRQLRQQHNSAGAAPAEDSGPIGPEGGQVPRPLDERSPRSPNDVSPLAGWPTSLPPTRASASGRLTGPLRLEPTAEATREQTSIFPIMGAASAHQRAAPGFAPLDGAAIPTARPFPDDTGQALITTTSMMAALGAGALLKGGRYRLVKRYSALVSLGRRGEPEPPLYVASDSEQPSTRVLVQELPLVEVPADLAERAQQQAAAHVRAAASRGVAPNLLDVFTERGRRFLVFELPAGEQLSEVMRRSADAAEDDIIHLGLSLLEAEAALWDLMPQLVHGNLCPDNVIVRPDGSLTFVGYSPTVLVRETALPDHGCAGGVRGYAAPEQQRGQADVRADLFAIAVILHQAATGQRPSALAGVAPGSARALNARVSPGLDELLSRALRPAPAQRISTVHELRVGLLALLPPASVGDARRSGDFSATAAGSAQHSALPESLAALRAGLEQPTPPLVRSRALRLVLLGLLLLALIGMETLYVSRSHAHDSAPQAQPTVDATAIALYSQSSIGVSDGHEIFDVTRTDASLKRQGAAALRGGDERSAYLLFKQASDADQGDVEAAIYAEDARIAAAGVPSLSIVVAASFGDASGATDSVLRGVFLAQQRINSLDLLPGTTQLRVLIANAGSAQGGAAPATQLIAKAAAASPSAHIIGVVGWPDEARTRTALSVLGTLPYLVPGAAVDGVSGPSYFALGPSDTQQGALLADAASAALHGRRVFVLVDPSDPRGVALASAFVAATHSSASASLVLTRQETLTGTQPAAFSQPAMDAVYSGSDTILVAGGAADAVGMAQALALKAPWAVGQVQILAPTWAYTPALLGVGTDATAQAVRSDPTALRSVTVASLASADEWTAAGVGEGQQPALFAAYTTRFGAVPSSGGLPEPDASVILGYDATQLLATAAVQATTGANLPDASGVRGAIAALRPGAGVQGVGGAIAFSGSGAPAGKALALLGLVPTAAGTTGGPVLAPTTVAIAGGTSAFCVSGGCTGG